MKRENRGKIVLIIGLLFLFFLGAHFALLELRTPYPHIPRTIAYCIAYSISFIFLILILHRINSWKKCVLATVLIPIISSSLGYVIYELIRLVIVGYKFKFLIFIMNSFISYIAIAGWIISVPVFLSCMLIMEKK